jgi:hypothetical protein
MKCFEVSADGEDPALVSILVPKVRKKVVILIAKARPCTAGSLSSVDHGHSPAQEDTEKGVVGIEEHTFMAEVAGEQAAHITS